MLVVSQRCVFSDVYQPRSNKVWSEPGTQLHWYVSPSVESQSLYLNPPQEWADYTSEVLPWIEEDRELDAQSRYPGSHHFEKMTAGLYMGDLARRIILRCGLHLSPPDRFPGRFPGELLRRVRLTSSHRESKRRACPWATSPPPQQNSASQWLFYLEMPLPLPTRLMQAATWALRFGGSQGIRGRLHRAARLQRAALL